MLPAAYRLRDGDGFRSATRRGTRASSRRLVVHLRLPETESDEGERSPSKVGFVVGRQVGTAVVRNVTKRRLRHIVRDRLDQLPAGSTLVVRAKPSAAGVSSVELRGDLDRAMARLELDVP